MKFTLAVIFTFTLFHAGIAQSDFPNGNFEGWNDTFAYANPQGYFTSNSWGLSPEGLSNVARTEQSAQGNYALEVRTVSHQGQVSPGVAMNATESNGIFTGGFPYNQEPDVLHGKIRYNAQNGDTASIEVIFKRYGDVKNYSRFTFFGTQSQWMDFSVPIPVFPPLPFGNYDTVVFRFRSSSPFVSQPNVGNYLAVDSLRFGNVFFQPPNMDFEDWDVYYPSWEPRNWHTLNRSFLHLGGQRYARASSDSYFGNFALYLIADVTPTGIARLGYATLDPSYDLGASTASSAFALTIVPDSVCFYYKYNDASSTGESGVVQIDFYRNGSSLNGLTIPLPEKANYTLISRAIPSLGGFTPTHMNAIIAPLDPNGAFTGLGNELWIDGLTFYCGSMSLSENELREGLWYPNPASSQIALSRELLLEKPDEYRIMDAHGKTVQKGVCPSEGMIFLQLKSGTYTIAFYRNRNLVVQGRLVVI